MYEVCSSDLTQSNRIENNLKHYLCPMSNNYYVYILLCSDKSYYVGMTDNIEKRFMEHQEAKDPTSYTAKRLPVELKFFAAFSDPTVSMDKEIQIKKWSRAKKE